MEYQGHKRVWGARGQVSPPDEKDSDLLTRKHDQSFNAKHNLKKTFILNLYTVYV